MNTELIFKEDAIDNSDIEFARFKLVEENAQLKIVRDNEGSSEAGIDDVLSFVLDKISQGYIIYIGGKQ